MARQKKIPTKQPLQVSTIKLTETEKGILRRLSQEASDNLGWTVTSSAIIRALIQHAGGQPPKPTALKILQGTFRKDQSNPQEPTAPPSSQEPPPHLTAQKRKEWAKICTVLLDMRVMTEADRNALVRYCMLQVLFLQTKRKAKKDPSVMGMVLKLAAELRSLEVQFRLTPSSRARVRTVFAKTSMPGAPLAQVDAQCTVPYRLDPGHARQATGLGRSLDHRKRAWVTALRCRDTLRDHV